MTPITGDELAFPITQQFDGEFHTHSGLTIRQYYAGLAMQGLLANPIVNNPNEKHKMITTENLSKSALSYADAIINELNTKNKQ